MPDWSQSLETDHEMSGVEPMEWQMKMLLGIPSIMASWR